VGLVPPLSDVADRTARPAAVRAALERLVEDQPALADELTADRRLLDALARVIDASPALTRLLHADGQALDVLRRLDERADTEVHDADALVAWKRRELLRIAARDLTGLDGLEQVAASLALLGDDVLSGALALAGQDGLAVIGMGKLGAGELNYASDVDVMFVGEGDPRPVLDVARRCFRVDANLRPEGRSGPLTRSLDSYRAYWDRWAEPWERQALIKARPVAGPGRLCAEFAAAAAEVVWDRPFGVDELRQVRSMKARAEGELARKGVSEREIKRGPGGIRDVEFAVQVLQLVHGGHDPALRVAATLPALGELAGAGYVDPQDASGLADAYRFLRTVEHRLQIAEEQQTHTVPANPDERQWLARLMGFEDLPAASARARFEEELRRHRSGARRIHERLFFRPLLEAFGGAERGRPAFGRTLSPEAAEERLSAFGFTSAERTRAALAELTRGLTRSSRLMQALLPLLLEWLSESPDPDLGLLGLRRLVGGPDHHRSLVVAVFRDSPDTARRLCLLLGTTPLAHEPIRHDPKLVDQLSRPGGLRARSRHELVAAARSTVDWRRSDEHRQAGASLFKRAEETMVMAADVLGEADVAEVGRRLTSLAEAVLETAVASAGSEVPLAVIGMGRFGGGELSYASDLDVLLVFPGHMSGDVAGVEEAAERLMRFVNGETPSRRIFTLDARLRPEGRQGPLARSLDGYDTYYRRWAQTWERQALLRARPVAGDPQVGEAFMELARRVVFDEPFGEDQAREIRRMKARIERERVPRGEDPEFHLKLGRGSLWDVEWTVQLLQLIHGVPGASTTAALTSLAGGGWMAAADSRRLADAYEFCERVRNRLYLVQGEPGDSLPTAPDLLGKLASSLDTTPSALRDHYRRVTRRARVVVERAFYGPG